MGGEQHRLHVLLLEFRIEPVQLLQCRQGLIQVAGLVLGYRLNVEISDGVLPRFRGGRHLAFGQLLGFLQVGLRVLQAGIVAQGQFELGDGQFILVVFQVGQAQIVVILGDFEALASAVFESVEHAQHTQCDHIDKHQGHGHRGQQGPQPNERTPFRFLLVLRFQVRKGRQLVGHRHQIAGLVLLLPKHITYPCTSIPIPYSATGSPC